MSKRVFASIGLLSFLVAASCARPFVAPAPPPVVPPADHNVAVIAKDRVWGGCSLDVRPPTVNARNGQAIQWYLVVEDAHCVADKAELKIVMKWKDCQGRPNSEEPLTFDPPGMGSRVGHVKPGAVNQRQCFQYGVFAGTLFKDPELIIDR
jgi:hypothetical protein